MGNLSAFFSLSDWYIKQLQGREVPHTFNVNHEAKLLFGSKLLHIIFLLQCLTLVTQYEL